MRVLVCGGRDYQDRQRVFDVLNEIDGDERKISAVIDGDATGADMWAGQWAVDIAIRERPRYPFTAIREPAEWKKYKNGAGPIRNTKMLREHKPDLVVAFPGGDGTADMVKKARKAGVEVMEVPY